VQDPPRPGIPMGERPGDPGRWDHARPEPKATMPIGISVAHPDPAPVSFGLVDLLPKPLLRGRMRKNGNR
jgi:hypothetical protein